MAELKCGRRVRLVRILVQIAHDIRLTLASGARAVPPQFLQRQITLGAIAPLDGEFLADLLHIHRSHPGKLVPVTPNAKSKSQVSLLPLPPGEARTADG